MVNMTFQGIQQHTHTQSRFCELSGAQSRSLARTSVILKCLTRPHCILRGEHFGDAGTITHQHQGYNVGDVQGVEEMCGGQCVRMYLSLNVDVWLGDMPHFLWWGLWAKLSSRSFHEDKHINKVFNKAALEGFV